VAHEDYTRTGYDRGHMAPSFGIGASWGSAAQRETFLTSNIAPQDPRINRGLWRAVEQDIAIDYTEAFGEVWVVCGPLYDPTDVDVLTAESGIHVPDGFYKIVLRRDQAGRVDALPLIVHQGGRNEPRWQYVSVDRIEDMTGLDFYHELENRLENELERASPPGMWRVPN
jgi:endonuclease G